MRKFLNFALGIGAGIGLGLLMAPSTGRETRHAVAEQARKLVHMPQRRLEKKIQEAAESAKEKAGDVGAKIGRNAAEAAVDAVTGNVADSPKGKMA